MTDSRGYIGTKKDTRPNSYYSGGRLIHNYFPDGRAEGTGTTDTGVYTTPVWWWRNMGGETITQVVDDAYSFDLSGHAIQCLTSGADWEEGLIAADLDHHLDSLPPGRYWFGIDLKVASGSYWAILLATPQGPNSVAALSVRLTTHWQRFVLPLVVTQTAWPILCVRLDQDQYPDEPSPLVVTFVADNVILTDGRADFYADGDSDGWAWTGEPYASASYGPQP